MQPQKESPEFPAQAGKNSTEIGGSLEATLPAEGRVGGLATEARKALQQRAEQVEGSLTAAVDCCETVRRAKEAIETNRKIRAELSSRAHGWAKRLAESHAWHPAGEPFFLQCFANLQTNIPCLKTCSLALLKNHLSQICYGPSFHAIPLVPQSHLKHVCEHIDSHNELLMMVVSLLCR